MRYFTGIDLHRKTSYLATADTKGLVVSKRNLLDSDLMAAVFVSSPQTRQLKELLRHRTQLIQDAAHMKHQSESSVHNAPPEPP